MIIGSKLSETRTSPRHKLHLDPVRVLHEQRVVIRASGREGIALAAEHGDFLLPAPGP